MLEDVRGLVTVFPAALIAGAVIATACSLMGVFVILKRVVFIGITLSEVAACGIAAGMVWSLNPFACACVLTTLVVAGLAYPFETRRIPRDAVLGVVFVLASSASILLVARSAHGLREVKTLLYGDLILASWGDLAVILAVLVPAVAYFLAFMRPTLYSFLDREAARASGIRVALWELAFFFALGLVVSAASKIAGALLVFCFLVVAPSAGLLLSRRLVVVMAASVTVAVGSTFVGLYLSFSRDLPTNQTVALVACVLLLAVVLWRAAGPAVGRTLGAGRRRDEGASAGAMGRD